MSAIAAAPVPERIRSTPYARRLARERGVPLSSLRGSGPNGRIVAEDVVRFEPPVETVAATPVSAETPKPAAVPAVPAALAATVDFAAVADLLVRIAELQPGIDREDVCLKAAAVALREAPALDRGGAILVAGSRREVGRTIANLSPLSLGGIAALRAGPGEDVSAGLAISFIGRPGLRPVAAPLAGEAAARLVIGGEGADGSADCLLSYDPDRLDDGDAAAYLATFKALIETPLRLLV